MDNGESKTKTAWSKAKQRVKIIIGYKQFLFGNDNDSGEKKKKKEASVKIACRVPQGVFIYV